MAGSLEFIKSVSGTSVGTLDVTDIFSANYDVYKITIAKMEQTNNGWNEMRFLDSGGSVISDSEYDNAVLELKSYSSFSEYRVTGANKIETIMYSGTGSAVAGGLVMYIFNPYNSSSYTFLTLQSNGFRDGLGQIGSKQISVHKSAEQISGVHFISGGSGSVFTNLDVSVYGVK
tara:strand:+ start:27 stop:548 length:522 start_codon:yes stop_codon:yes gene_type:complete